MGLVTCIDERPGSDQRVAATFAASAPAITAAELIRARVELEVERLQAEQREKHASDEVAQAAVRAGFGDWLVRPDAVETMLNGDRGAYGPGTRALPREPGAGAWEPDLEAMVEAALEGFRRGHFFLFAHDRQVVELGEEIDLRGTAEVVFLRLIPLVGG